MRINKSSYLVYDIDRSQKGLYKFKITVTDVYPMNVQ